MCHVEPPELSVPDEPFVRIAAPESYAYVRSMVEAGLGAPRPHGVAAGLNRLTIHRRIGHDGAVQAEPAELTAPLVRARHARHPPPDTTNVRQRGLGCVRFATRRPA